MAIVFLQQKRVQKSLIFIFAAVLVITAIIIWQGFFKKEEIPLKEEVILMPEREIEINYGVLKNQILEKLQSFSEIEPFKETLPTEGEGGERIGRENPFQPY